MQTWKIKYLEMLSELDTPMLILRKLKKSYNQLVTARESEEFRELERQASQVFKESLYASLLQASQDNPNLLLKLCEKVSLDKLKPERTALINIDNSKTTQQLTVLPSSDGTSYLTQDEAYAETAKLLDAYASKNKQLGNDTKQAISEASQNQSGN